MLLSQFIFIVFLYNYDSTQIYNKLKLYNRQVSKYSKDFWEGKENYYNKIKYWKKKNIYVYIYKYIYIYIYILLDYFVLNIYIPNEWC